MRPSSIRLGDDEVVIVYKTILSSPLLEVV